MEQKTDNLNNFLESLDNEYSIHKTEVEEELHIEEKIMSTFKKIDNTQNLEKEPKKINSTIDREIELWGESALRFSFTDSDSFHTNNSKQFDKINQRLNERHDYPKVLPFQRELAAFQLRPQLSRDLEKTFKKN